MAKPTTKLGYIPAEYEWLASILLAGFSGIEAYVANEVYVQVYGLAKLDVATLSPADIARRSGKEPSNVSKAIRGMVAQVLLEKVADQQYRPVEDYTRWVLRAEKPESRVARIAYCQNAPRLARSFRRLDAKPPDSTKANGLQQLSFLDDPPRSPTAPDMIQVDHNHDPSRSCDMIQVDHNHDPSRSCDMIQVDHVLPTPIEDRARGIENLREKGRRGGEGETPAPDSIFDSQKEPRKPDPNIERFRKVFDQHRQSLPTGGNGYSS